MKKEGMKLSGAFGRWLTALALLLATMWPALGVQAQAGEAGGTVTVVTIYTNVPGEPTAGVPGMPGVFFEPGTGTTHFDRVFGSPNGNWVLQANNDSSDFNTDEMILVNGVVKVVEDDPTPWDGALIDLINQRSVINDNGEWAFAMNTDGDTGSDEYMVYVSAADVMTYTAREGDAAIAGLPGANWGSTLESANIASDGTVGFAADSLQNQPTTENEALIFGNTLLALEGVTVPAGQVGSEFWENFDLGDYWITPDGNNWLAQGDLTGTTASDDVVVVNGTVMIQEGSILPGTTFPNPVDSSGIVGVHMAPNGDWFARGNNDISELDWVYGNNGLIASGGDPIFTGATENWDDTDFGALFFLHVGDGNGNYVIGGVTDAVSTANGVLVLNNDQVIVRESDPIDLDNNGTMDDDAFFDTFGNDDAYLADDGTFYFVATIKDGTDTRIGQGFFSIDLSPLFNTPPQLQNMTATSPVNENDVVTLSGDITDPDSGDTFELMVDWGDTTVMTYTYGAGTTSFSETHQYLDDDPSGTPSDTYNINATLTDSSGGVGTAVSATTVNNVAPTVDAGADQTVAVGEPVNFAGSFTDPGTLDSHTIDWDFGDSNGDSGSLTPTHTYTSAGDYTVTLTVTDDDTGVGADTLTVLVIQPTDVTLTAFDGGASGTLPFALLAGLALLLVGLWWRGPRLRRQR